MNTVSPIPFDSPDKTRYNVTINAGFSGKLTLEDLDACDILNFLKFFNRMHFYDYYNNESKVAILVEAANGES